MNLLRDFNTYMWYCIELYCVCVQPFLQDTLQKQECLKMQREAVKHRVRQLAARQSEISVSLRFCYFGVSVPLQNKSLRCDDD